MTWRELPPAEWGRLAGTEAAGLAHEFVPGECHVLVVEDAGAIVGTWVFLRVVHGECVWIAPSHRRRGSVARRLLAGMRQIVTRMGARAFMTGAITPDVERLITRLHGRVLPGTHWLVPVKE